MKKARELAGLNQDEMSAATGISRGTVSHLELDKAPLKVSYLKLWAMATGVPAEWLENGDQPIGPTPGPGESTTPETSALAQLTRNKRARHPGGHTRGYVAAA